MMLHAKLVARALQALALLQLLGPAARTAATRHAMDSSTPTFTQTVYDTNDQCGENNHKVVTKIPLSTSTSQHCVETHNWGKVIATCKAGENGKPAILTYTLFDDDNCTGHSPAGTRSWALGECVQGFGQSWKYTDCQGTTPAAPPATPAAAAPTRAPAGSRSKNNPERTFMAWMLADATATPAMWAARTANIKAHAENMTAASRNLRVRLGGIAGARPLFACTEIGVNGLLWC